MSNDTILRKLYASKRSHEESLELINETIAILEASERKPKRVRKVEEVRINYERKLSSKWLNQKPVTKL